MAKTIGAIVKRVLKDLRLGKKLLQYEVLGEWDKIVGERIARAATAERVVNGKLIVKVKSSAWRNELSFMKREIIERINGKFNEEVITDIIFK